MRLLKTCTCCIIALTIAGLALPQDTADLPLVNAVRTTQPITIDGNLDEPVWATDAEWYGQFSLLGKPDLKASVQTRFKVAFDDENIYLAAVLDEPHMDKLKETATQRDRHIHRDDCLEIMLDPQGERTEYFHFAVNSLGTLYDAELALLLQIEWRHALAIGALIALQLQPARSRPLLGRRRAECRENATQAEAYAQHRGRERTHPVQNGPSVA